MNCGADPRVRALGPAGLPALGVADLLLDLYSTDASSHGYERCVMMQSILAHDPGFARETLLCGAPAWTAAVSWGVRGLGGPMAALAAVGDPGLWVREPAEALARVPEVDWSELIGYVPDVQLAPMMDRVLVARAGDARVIALVAACKGRYRPSDELLDMVRGATPGFRIDADGGRTPAPRAEPSGEDRAALDAWAVRYRMRDAIDLAARFETPTAPSP